MRIDEHGKAGVFEPPCHADGHIDFLHYETAILPIEIFGATLSSPHRSTGQADGRMRARSSIFAASLSQEARTWRDMLSGLRRFLVRRLALLRC